MMMTKKNQLTKRRVIFHPVFHLKYKNKIKLKIHSSVFEITQLTLKTQARHEMRTANERTDGTVVGGSKRPMTSRIFSKHSL